MTQNTYLLSIEYDGRLAELLVKLAVALRWLIGARLALRLALWCGYRFVRWRFPGGPWHRGVAREWRQMSLLVPGVPPS